ncbi:MAG: hypothetical protein NVS9B1_11690 [Candidatus Dormibacteraceae bacterium]
MAKFRSLGAKRVGARRRGVSTIGLVLIVLGLVALLVTMTGWSAYVARYWPLVLVALGLLGLFRRPAWLLELDALVPGLATASDRYRRRFSLSLVALGLVLLLFTAHLIDPRIAGPAVIIALGAALLWRRTR